MRRFLVRAKACHEKELFENFGPSGRLAYPGKKNTPPERTSMYSPGSIFVRYNLFIPAYLEMVVKQRQDGHEIMRAVRAHKQNGYGTHYGCLSGQHTHR